MKPGILAEWLLDTSISGACLAVMWMLIRALPGSRIHPRWLLLGGWLVIFKFLVPAAFPLSWAVDGLWKNNFGQKKMNIGLYSGDGNNMVRNAPVGGAASQGTIPLPEDATLMVTGRAQSLPWKPVALICWAAGCGAFLAGVVSRHRRLVRRHLASGSRALPVHWQAIVKETRCLAGLSYNPDVRMSHGLSVSFVSGVGRPTIWLPEEALETWTSTDLRNVLIHEMMHLRHHDIAANWFLVMVRAIHWFNPLVHLTFRNFVTDRELLRDRQSLAGLEGPDSRRAYGLTLLKMATQPLAPKLSPAGAAFFHSNYKLKRRLTMITNTSRPQWLHNGTAAALTALAVSASFATSEPAATDSVRDPAPAKKLSLPEGQAELVFPENVAEVPSVFQSIGKQPMVQDMHITNAELIKTYDAALPPMRTSNFRRAPGDPEPPKMDLAGAYSAQPLQGNFPPIMLFGPYEEVTPGDYLVVYRFQILEVPEGKASLFFDVAHNACTTGGVRIPASSFEVGKWAEVAVPVTVPVNKTLEFRFWHGGAKAAVDRIYLFQVKLSEKAPDGEVPAGLPVDGREDVLRSPFGNESGMIDVVGFPAGSRIRCPYSGKFFRIP